MAGSPKINLQKSAGQVLHHNTDFKRERFLFKSSSVSMTKWLPGTSVPCGQPGLTSHVQRHPSERWAHTQPSRKARWWGSFHTYTDKTGIMNSENYILNGLLFSIMVDTAPQSAQALLSQELLRTAVLRQRQYSRFPPSFFPQHFILMSANNRKSKKAALPQNPQN